VEGDALCTRLQRGGVSEIRVFGSLPIEKRRSKFLRRLTICAPRHLAGDIKARILVIADRVSDRAEILTVCVS